MAVRKPLVIVGGQIQQLQSGDSIEVPQTGVSVVIMNNGAAGLINPGYAVFVSGASEVDLADRRSSGSKSVLGIAGEAVEFEGSGVIITNGLFDQPTAAWDLATGDTGGLTPGKKYYLGEDGQLEEGPPTAEAGEYVVEIGIAISATEMKVEPKTSILL